MEHVTTWDAVEDTIVCDFVLDEEGFPIDWVYESNDNQRVRMI